MVQRRWVNGGRALTSFELGVIKYLTIFYLGIQVGLLYTTTSTSDCNDSSIPASIIAMGTNVSSGGGAAVKQ